MDWIIMDNREEIFSQIKTLCLCEKNCDNINHFRKNFLSKFFERKLPSLRFYHIGNCGSTNHSNKKRNFLQSSAQCNGIIAFALDFLLQKKHMNTIYKRVTKCYSGYRLWV